MKFSISSLVSALDPYEALIWEYRADTRADIENAM